MCQRVTTCDLLKVIYSVGQGHGFGRNMFSLVHLHDLRPNRSTVFFKYITNLILAVQDFPIDIFWKSNFKTRIG